MAYDKYKNSPRGSKCWYGANACPFSTLLSKCSLNKSCNSMDKERGVRKVVESVAETSWGKVVVKSRRQDSSSRCWRETGLVGILVSYNRQGTKKIRPDSLGLVDFVVGLVEFILHLPDGQVTVFGEFFNFLINRSTVKHQKNFGLVHLGYSLPEGQAWKLNFFAPWYGWQKRGKAYNSSTDPRAVMGVSTQGRFWTLPQDVHLV